MPEKLKTIHYQQQQKATTQIDSNQDKLTHSSPTFLSLNSLRIHKAFAKMKISISPIYYYSYKVYIFEKGNYFHF